MTTFTEKAIMDTQEQIEQTAHRLEEQVRPQIERATQSLTHLSEQVTTYIRANPGKCLIGAVATGYIVGRIAQSR